MQKSQYIKDNPVAGSKPTSARKRPKDDPQGSPAAEDAGETAGETQARESEVALERALGRMPPG